MDKKLNNKKIFKLDAYLAKNIKWANYEIVEIKTIASLYATINPEWKELNVIKWNAKDFRENLGLSGNRGFNDIYKVFENIQSKSVKMIVPKYYNLTESEIKELIEKESKEDKQDNENNIDMKSEMSSEKQLFPCKKVSVSLIGSIATLYNQKSPDYNIKAQYMEFSFDEHIKRHILFAKNAIKDNDGNIISGVNQYFDCEVDKINNFKSVYALRLFMSLFHYNGISKTFRFEELSEIIGIKTQKANFKTELKSRTSTNPKIDKKLKKYYNFKRRTLKKIFEEIYICTGLNLSFKDSISTNEDGDIEIFIKINIPNYRDNHLECKKEIISDGADKKEDDDEDNNTPENVIEKDISEESDMPDYNEIKESDSINFTDADWSQALFDNFGVENDNFNIEDSKSNINDEDKVHIANLALIHNLEESVVESLYIENNKNPQEVNKILSNEKI